MWRKTLGAIGLIFGAMTLGVSCAASQESPKNVGPCEHAATTQCVGQLVCDYDFARACELCRCVAPKLPTENHNPPLIASPLK